MNAETPNTKRNLTNLFVGGCQIYKLTFIVSRFNKVL